MKFAPLTRQSVVVTCVLTTSAAFALVTYTDNFDVPVDCLTNGVVGTIWDGIYLGADEIANATGLGAAPGSVSVADANITSNNALTVASVHTDWENNADDGFFPIQGCDRRLQHERACFRADRYRCIQFSGSDDSCVWTERITAPANK